MEMFRKVEELKAKQQSQSAQDLYSTMAPVAGIAPVTGHSNQQQKLRVCDVCGALLSIHDSDRRLADHFGGKLHIGYLQIREKLDELLVRFLDLTTFLRNSPC